MQRYLPAFTDAVSAITSFVIICLVINGLNLESASKDENTPSSSPSFRSGSALLLEDYYPLVTPTLYSSYEHIRNGRYLSNDSSMEALISLPTFSPTYRPTKRPTFTPTFRPTIIPTFTPSAMPTYHPSFIPTVLPTTSKPSVIPTFLPTVTPTKAPTPRPSAHPTYYPSSQPTSQPTAQPTNPTGNILLIFLSLLEFVILRSANASTNFATFKTTDISTKQTTNSHPSHQPSTQPSSSPSSQPTSNPTNPTSQPTSSPTSPAPPQAHYTQGNQRYYVNLWLLLEFFTMIVTLRTRYLSMNIADPIEEVTNNENINLNLAEGVILKLLQTIFGMLLVVPTAGFMGERLRNDYSTVNPSPFVSNRLCLYVSSILFWICISNFFACHYAMDVKLKTKNFPYIPIISDLIFLGSVLLAASLQSFFYIYLVIYASFYDWIDPEAYKKIQDTRKKAWEKMVIKTFLSFLYQLV